jgi:4-hydroxybenzoate polyprenyltransferase
MSIGLRSIILGMVFVFVVVAGGIVLQIFLSKKEGKWPGLILPLVSFLISLLAVMSIAVFQFHTETETVVENGVVIRQAVPGTPTQQTMETGELVMTIAYVPLLYNIPAAILLAIYAACRGKRKRQRALEKMSVQDLE